MSRCIPVLERLGGMILVGFSQEREYSNLVLTFMTVPSLLFCWGGVRKGLSDACCSSWFFTSRRVFDDFVVTLSVLRYIYTSCRNLPNIGFHFFIMTHA